MVLNQQDITENPSSTALPSHTPESFFRFNKSSEPAGRRFGKIRSQLGQTLQQASRITAKAPSSPIQDSEFPRWNPPSYIPIANIRASESGANPGMDTSTDDEDDRTMPVADAPEEITSEADFITRRYTVRSTTDTVITYATSLAPSDMPLYTRMETSSIAASLSDQMSWRRSTETRADTRASTVSTERPEDIVTGPALLSPPSQSQVYPWSAHHLILKPSVAIPKPGIVPPVSPSPPPFPRSGHALPATSTETGDLFIFGGLVGETARNDLYQFSTRDLSATLLQACGEIPSPRVGHVSALAGRSTLVMWGGDTKTDPNSKSTDKYDNGLYLLDVGLYLDFSGPL